MQILTTQADDLEGNSKFTILTIDDESYIRQSLKSFFEDYGFVVFEALVEERTKALVQSEQRYKAVFECSGIAAFIMEPDDIFPW